MGWPTLSLQLYRLDGAGPGDAICWTLEKKNCLVPCGMGDPFCHADYRVVLADHPSEHDVCENADAVRQVSSTNGNGVDLGVCGTILYVDRQCSFSAVNLAANRSIAL